MGELQVVPGRMDERPSPHGEGVEREAHGEFIVPNGELASYAFGWSTAPGAHQGRMTVGIGAGNEGGGSFHAVITDQDGSYALGLVDEPFADVPEGGPDLSRESALAHEDLPFVWFVADWVLLRDPRARWLLHWLKGTRAIATPEVESGADPVLYVQHDEDDGLWQCIGITSPDGATGVILHLSHLIDADPSLMDALFLDPGEATWREARGLPWHPAEAAVEDGGDDGAAPPPAPEEPGGRGRRWRRRR